MAAFWVVAPCRLVWVYRPVRGPYCLHFQGDVLFGDDLLRLGLTQPSVQWMKVVKWPKLKTDHSPPSRTYGGSEWMDVCLHSRIRLYGVVLMHKDSLARAWKGITRAKTCAVIYKMYWWGVCFSKKQNSFWKITGECVFVRSPAAKQPLATISYTFLYRYAGNLT
jgi:hypothetical protein